MIFYINCYIAVVNDVEHCVIQDSTTGRTTHSLPCLVSVANLKAHINIECVYRHTKITLGHVIQCYSLKCL